MSFNLASLDGTITRILASYQCAMRLTLTHHDTRCLPKLITMSLFLLGCRHDVSGALPQNVEGRSAAPTSPVSPLVTCRHDAHGALRQKDTKERGGMRHGNVNSIQQISRHLVAAAYLTCPLRHDILMHSRCKLPRVGCATET